MNYTTIILVLLVLTVFGYFVGRRRVRREKAAAAVSPGKTLPFHSLPSHYGTFVAFWVLLPAVAIFLIWMVLQGTIVDGLVWNGLPDKVTIAGDEKAVADLTASEKQRLADNIRNLARGDITTGTVSPSMRAAAAHFRRLQSLSTVILGVTMAIIALVAMFYAYRRINPALRARNRVERTVMVLLVICSLIAIFTTVGIVLSLLFEAFAFFTKVSPIEFLFGLTWSPQEAIRADQVGSSGSFGAIPVFVGTLLITVIAMVVAVPVGLFAAVYLSEYASSRVRWIVKPVLELLAGIPTVVYGFFAALTLAPFIRDVGQSIGLSVASESALAAGVVMGIMIIPFVSSLSDDVITAVPQALRDGSLGLGATHSETVRQVVLPAALPGIVGAVLLAVSRAIGETMIVVMAAGLSAKLTINPLDAVTTVTVQIVTNLTGDPEFDSAKTLSAFALGLVLFIVTLCLNIVALRVVQKYREKYD